MYRTVESLYGTPEMNITVYVNYSGIKFKKQVNRVRKREKEMAENTSTNL